MAGVGGVVDDINRVLLPNGSNAGGLLLWLLWFKLVLHFEALDGPPSPPPRLAGPAIVAGGLIGLGGGLSIALT